MAAKYEDWDVQTERQQGETWMSLKVVKPDGHLVDWPVFTAMALWTGECGYPQHGGIVWLMQPRAWRNKETGNVVSKPKRDDEAQPAEIFEPILPTKVRVHR